MKEKVISTIMIAMLGVLPCFASSSLVIHLTDGTAVVCSLTKEPQMLFDEKTITLSSLDGAVGQWDFAEVESWTFDDSEDRIDEAKEQHTQIRIEGSKLTITGTNAKDVAIYDLNGRLRTPRLTATSNTITISLNGLTKGTYVLKVGKNSAKFTTK